MNIALESISAKLPIMKIQDSIQSHTEVLMKMLPDKRMKKVLENMLLGILGGQTPLITGMARQNGKSEGGRKKHVSLIGKQAFGNESAVSRSV